MSSDPQRPNVFTPFLRRFTSEPARELSETIALYKEVRSASSASIWSGPASVDHVASRCANLILEYTSLPAYAPLVRALDKCLSEIIGLEETIVSFPEIDWSRARLRG